MSSCSNTSNLSGNLNVNSISHSGARLLMTHPLSGFSGGKVSSYVGDDGITAGDAIRYNAVEYHVTSNPSGGKYVKAKADAAENSEVVGIVETIEGQNRDGTSTEDSLVYVVLSGQISFPSDKLVSATHIFDFENDDTYISGASGGNDIYFLSEVTAGVIQNLAPTTPTTIAKPILQQAADGDYNAHVVNYIGYQVGGEVVGTLEEDEPATTIVNIPDFNGNNFTNGANDWFDLNERNLLPANTGAYGYIPGNSTYANALSNFRTYGVWWKVNFTGTIQNADVGKPIQTRNSDGSVKVGGNLEILERANKCLYVRTTSTEDISVGDILYARTGKYTVTDCFVSNFYLPLVKGSTSKTIFVDADNRSKSVPERKALKVPSDLHPASRGENPGPRGTAVTIPSEVTLKKATVTDGLTVSSAEHNLKGVDIIKLIKDHDDEIASVKSTLNQSKTSVNITNRNT